MLALAIDTASDIAGVALTEDDALLGEVTWRSRQNHSRQLLPTVDWLLQRCQRAKTDIGAVFVCLGPGSYAGLRVGLSTAKALAWGFGVPIVGVGRLAADAFLIAAATEREVVAVQAAGRAEVAWAVYRYKEGGLEEVVPPRLNAASGPGGFTEGVPVGAAVCGDIDKLDEAARAALRVAQRARLVEAPASRVIAVARLGWLRLARGEVDNADTLVPLYLRAPAIGPQPPRP